MIDLVSKRRWFFLGSSLVILVGIVFLVLFGLNLGLDFKSGSTMTLVFTDQSVTEDSLRSALADEGHSEPVIQGTQKTGYTVTETEATPWPPDIKDKVIAALHDQDYGTSSVFVYIEEDTTLYLIFNNPPDEGKVKDALQNVGCSYESFEDMDPEPKAYLVRTATISEIGPLKEVLEDKFGSLAVFDFDTVSPLIATEIGRNAAIAVGVACIGILLYLAWAFRKMPRPFLYGACAIIALIHDSLIVIGIFAILGRLAGIEVSVLFVTGILAIIGYSVNDTVVVFDSIRENMGKRTGISFEMVVNNSLNEVLTRSLATSLTTLLVVLALFFLGGETIHTFILVLLIGIIAGTYSSICIASQLLIVWEKGEWRRFLPPPWREE